MLTLRRFRRCEADMEVIPDPRTWAEFHFGGADLKDRRRAQRLLDVAAKIAARPEKPFTQVFGWNDLRAFYRLCDRQETTLDAVQSPHWQRTRQAMARHPLVLILHDTTGLDFSGHAALRGLGPIGEGHGRGFLQHNSLAILPAGQQVLGLAFQQLTIRKPAPPGESAYQRKRRPRESDLWPQGFAAIGQPPPQSCWVDVCDRGGDDYRALRQSLDSGHHFLLRASQNRVVFVTPEHDRQEYLLDYARGLVAQAADVVDIPGRGGRPPRTAAVALAGAPVWLPAPAGTAEQKSQPVLAAWVIRIWEPDPPAEVAEPLEWVLLCSLPTAGAAELKERRDWYCCRWQIEKAQAVYPSRRRRGGARRIGYHRHNGVARAGRVVPATPGDPHRRSRMSETTRRPTPPRA